MKTSIAVIVTLILLFSSCSDTQDHSKSQNIEPISSTDTTVKKTENISPKLTQTLLIDSTSGCKYILPWNCDVCSLSWTGNCIDSLPNGNGELMVYYEGEPMIRYEGEMKNGQFNGIGNYVDGRNKWDGYFKDGNYINLTPSFISNLEKNILNNIDSTGIYVGDGTSQQLFYYALHPKEIIEGTLVLFPSSWETAESVINNNVELIEFAYKKNLMLIIPSINYNLCLDEIAMSFLNSTFKHMIDKYAPPLEKIVLGGFSLGGINAIRYTEMAYSGDRKTMFKPIAVYGVDPPLDLERLYQSFERTIQKNFSKLAVAEATDYINKMNLKFEGGPEKFKKTYIKYSAYSKSELDGGNAKHLINVPIRIYCDPDIEWLLNNRRMDYSDMNAMDQTAMINYLLLAGNADAEFISAIGKGYRLDGRRHPHSWSLVEPKECIDWIIKILK